MVVAVGGGGGAGTPFMPGCYEYFFIALGLGLVFMASDLFLGRNLLFSQHLKEKATVFCTREANRSVVDMFERFLIHCPQCFPSPIHWFNVPPFPVYR